MTFLNPIKKEYPLEIRVIPVLREVLSTGRSRKGVLILRKVPYPGDHTILEYDFPIRPGGYALHTSEFLENSAGLLERVAGGWLPVEYWNLSAREAVSAKSRALYEIMGDVFNDPDASEKLTLFHP